MKKTTTLFILFSALVIIGFSIDLQNDRHIEDTIDKEKKNNEKRGHTIAGLNNPAISLTHSDEERRPGLAKKRNSAIAQEKKSASTEERKFALADKQTVQSIPTETSFKSSVNRDSGYVTYIQDFLPFQQVPRHILDSSGRKILTHWHSFVLAFNNKRESEDHYTTYRLNPNNSKFASTGGQMRQRPYYRPPRDGEKSFLVQDFETEINTFMDIGGDGFFLNMISKPFNETGGGRWNHYYACAEAASNVSDDFAIIPSPDCGATFKQQNVDDFVKIMNWIQEQPNRLEIDGKTAFSAWHPGVHPLSFWNEVFDECKANNAEAAFIPCYHINEEGGITDWKNLLPLCHAFMKSSFASAYEHALKANSRNLANEVHGAGMDKFVHTIRGNDARAHSGVYFEPANFRNLMETWDIAIDHLDNYPQDWVQLYTWNDIHENQGMHPFTGIQYALYDINAYYIQWYKTGEKPDIIKDALYYSHRRHHMNAQPDFSKQTAGKFRVLGNTDTQNDIQLLSFLTKPGTLKIKVGDSLYTKEADAGINSFIVPIQEGVPRFYLIRGNKVVTETVSKWPVDNDIVYEDPLYRAGGSLRQYDLRKTYSITSKAESTLLGIVNEKIVTGLDEQAGKNAQWRFEPVVGTEFYPHYTTVYLRISLAGDSGEALYYEDEELQYGFVDKDNKKAMWEYVRDYNTHDVWIKNADEIDWYITNDTTNNEAGLAMPKYSWSQSKWHIQSIPDTSDQIAPVILTPYRDTVLTGDENGQAIMPDFAVTAEVRDDSDDPEKLTITQHPEAGTMVSCANTVHLTVADSQGNTTRVSFNVNVKDEEAPQVLKAPGDTLINVGYDCKAEMPDFSLLMEIHDNCDTMPQVEQIPEPGSFLEDTLNEVVIKITDKSGNIAEHTLQVRVRDNIAPNITCVSDQVVDMSPGDTLYQVTHTGFDPVFMNDNCEITEVTNDYNNLPSLENAELPRGTTTVTWTVADEFGNETRCSFDIQVNKPVGIEAMKQADIALYPNPSEGKFFFQSTKQIIHHIEVKDLRGRVVLDQQVAQTKGIIDLSGFQDGMYVVSLMMKNKTVDVKVQKNE